MIYERFYAELGKLLYAIADVDGWISPIEKIKLRNIIKNELVPTESRTDKYGSDMAYYAEMEFDFLDEQITDVDSAFNSFIDFVEEHHTAFDDRIKMACVQLVNELAKIYRGANKKEQVLIDKLKKSFQIIEMKNNSSKSNSREFMIFRTPKKSN